MNTRELAQRMNGMVEVRLLWYPELDRVELAVHDAATDVSFELEVAPADAIDAFYHPYAYAARRTRRPPSSARTATHLTVTPCPPFKQ